MTVPQISPHRDLAAGRGTTGLSAQWRSLRPLMAVLYLPVALALIGVVAIRLTTGEPMGNLTRDTAQVAMVPVYTGVLSNLGVLAWTVGAWAALLAAAALTGRSAERRFLFASGLVTVVLLLDDFFMLHEIVFPRYVGIPEYVVYGLYAMMLAWLLIAHRRVILERTPYLLLAVATAALGLMLLADVLESVSPLPGHYLVEDGLKFFGIVNWSAYLVLVSLRCLRQRTGSTPSPPA